MAAEHRRIMFPELHPELVDPELGAAASFFDPGLAPRDDGVRRAASDRLPLAGKALDAVLAQYDGLGAEIRGFRDLETLRSMVSDDMFSETALGIRAELSDRMDPDRSRETRRKTARAQLTLCLAYRLEERIMELAGLEKGLGKHWKALEEALGVEEGDELRKTVLSSSNLAPNVVYEHDFAIPWTTILTALLEFLDDGDALVTENPEIHETLADRGVEFVPADPGPGFPKGEYLKTEAPGYILALRTRPQAGRERLNAVRTLFYRKRPEG